MKELKKYLTDIRFIIPAGFLVLFELFMQSGLYTALLKPRSYAANVNNIVNTVQHSKVKSNVLILGTSVAYQGVNLPLLNSLLEKEDLRVQSGATEGAMLITQHLIFDSLIKKLPETKVIIHFSEISFPWTARYSLDISNRSMISQFPLTDAFRLLSEYDYRLTASDYSYLISKTITYQSDLRDFTLSPLYRIKLLSREWKLPHRDFPYENQYSYSMAVINKKSLKDCVKNFPAGLPQIDADGKRITDRMHLEAMFRTCQLSLHDPMDVAGAPQWRDLYFRRLKVFMDEIESRNIIFVTVLPPYSQLIKDEKEESRLAQWDSKLEEIRNGKKSILIDLRHSLDGPDNSSLYYDTIHLNREGSLRLTKELARSVQELIQKGELVIP